MSSVQQNREAWLTELALRLQPIHGKTLPKIRIACSWPSTRAKTQGSKRLGECWHAESSKDGTREIMITPVMDDPIEVAETVLHETLHAVLPPGAGHKAPFARLAKACGLEGKPTTTFAGPKLRERLKEITDELGPYPHAAIDTSGKVKQPTRLLKVSCSECGYIIRVTLKWIEEAGYPVCPQCHVEMGEDHDTENPLVIDEQSVEYAFKAWGDDRFKIRLSKRRGKAQWFVLDYGEQGFFATGTARVVPAEGRQDAIEIAESIQEGLLTHDELAERVPEWLEDEGEDVTPEDDWEKLQGLSDEEEEEHDHEDDLDEHEEELYNRNQKGRES